MEARRDSPRGREWASRGLVELLEHAGIASVVLKICAIRPLLPAARWTVVMPSTPSRALILFFRCLWPLTIFRLRNSYAPALSSFAVLTWPVLDREIGLDWRVPA